MKVAVIRFSSLGDCTLLCPFLQHLKTHGATEVIVVTKRAYAELFAAATAVDRIVALGDDAGWRGVLQIIHSLRDEGCLVIDGHNTPRSRAVSAGLGGAATRVRKYYRERLGLILFKRHSTIPTIAARYSALGEELGLPPVPVTTGCIEVPPEIVVRVNERIGDDESMFVSLAPGSRWPMKRWGIDKFTELAQRISDNHGCRLILLGDGKDEKAAERIATALGDRAVDLTGRTSITETAAAIQRSSAFIGNDSGLMHLAEAVDVPVVALFGPTVEAFGYYPSLETSEVVERDIPCRPCSRNGSRNCPKGTQECLTAIAVDPVEEALNNLLLSQDRVERVPG
jgi:heptosyltransferase-2